MKTIIIQIGNSDDKLTQHEWSSYVSRVKNAIKTYAHETHFFGGSPNWFAWQNVCWVVIVNGEYLMALKQALTAIRESYKQESIAWTVGDTVFI